MKRNLHVALKNLDGTIITEAVAEQVAVGKPVVTKVTEVMMSAVAVNALLGNYEDERGLSGDEKVKRFKLAQRIHGTKTSVELSAEDVTLLKTLIAKMYSPLVVGQAFDILETDPTAPNAA